MKQSGQIYLAILWAIGGTQARAEDVDWRDCPTASIRDGLIHVVNPDVSIAACTRFLARGNRESRSRRAFALHERCNTYWMMGNADRAIPDCTQAIRLDPNDADFYHSRGLAYSQKGDEDRAIADYNQAIRLGLKGENVYINRGLSYVEKAEFDRAIADFDEAIQLNPREPRAFVDRGTALERRGDRARARTDFEAALALDSDNTAAKEGLARLARTDSVPSGAPIVATKSCSSLGKRVALVVGNSAYARAARLVNPANDADDVTALLRDKLCFTVIEAKDVTRETFSRKIGEFAEAASGADVALFYYAGHGAQFQNANYLLPVDSRMANEYDAIHGNISAQDMIATIETRAKAMLVFLDACRDNPIEEDFRRRMASTGRGFGDTRGLAPMTGRSSETLVVFATRPNERAADGASRNSPFTEAFLQHIATPGKDIELVMRDVAASVRAKTNGRQIPQRLTELEHGLMLLPGR